MAEKKWRSTGVVNFSHQEKDLSTNDCDEMETVFKYKSCYLKILTRSKFHFPLWYDDWGFFGWNWHLILTSRQKKAGKILKELFSHLFTYLMT